jgi:hypothetical protein
MESCEIDVEDLQFYLDDLSIEEIEDTVSYETARRLAH